MTAEEVKKEILSKIKWESYPKRDGTGGQTVSRVSGGVTLICEETDTRISINSQRSQLKNKEMAYLLFSLFLDEEIK